MLKIISVTLITLIAHSLYAQAINPIGLQSYQYLCKDKKLHQMILTIDKPTEISWNGTIRVKYIEIGEEIIAEYPIKLTITTDSNKVNIIPINQNIKYIKGKGKYKPDSFEMYFPTNETQEIYLTTDGSLSYVEPYSPPSVISLFYQEEDPLYNHLTKLEIASINKSTKQAKLLTRKHTTPPH